MEDDIRILRLISFIARKQQSKLSRKIAKYNLTAGEFPIYMAICNNQGFTQDQISDYVYVDKGFTTRVIKNLEKKGYIYRQKDEKDKRINHVYPTELALSIHEELSEILTNNNANATKAFSLEEKLQFKEYLTKLDEALDEL